MADHREEHNAASRAWLAANREEAQAAIRAHSVKLRTTHD